MQVRTRPECTAALILGLVTLLVSCQRPAAPEGAKNLEQVQRNQTDAGTSEAGETSDSLPESSEIDVPTPSGKLLEKATACTVRLSGEDFDGSGVIVQRDNEKLYVLTVAHAVSAGIRQVDLFSLETFPKPAASFDRIKVISADNRSDLALIVVTVTAETETTSAGLADTNEKPQFAYSVGCGNGQPPRILSEQIRRSATFQIKLPGGTAKRFMWETKNAQQQGRSGGPLLDVNGCLLGIALGKHNDSGYYAHVREISEYFIDNDLGALVVCAKLSKSRGNTDYNR